MYLLGQISLAVVEYLQEEVTTLMDLPNQKERDDDLTKSS